MPYREVDLDKAARNVLTQEQFEQAGGEGTVASWRNGVCAAVALAMMLVGAMGMKIVPAAYFGVVERFSVFAATGFNAALGIHLFCMKSEI